MGLIYFIIATGVVATLFYWGVSVYDRKHNYDW